MMPQRYGSLFICDMVLNKSGLFKFNGWTSLLLASRRGYLKIVKLLLDHGADPNRQNEVSQ